MIYRFGDFELTSETYELCRAGVPVHVEPLVFEVLADLIAHRERVVTKSELLDRLWPGQTVSESALTRAVREARRALGDTGARRRWIQTVHGRGFRFEGHVEEGHPTGLAEPPADRPALVVLPLEDHSEDPGQAFFADSMTEALTTELATIRSLKVISRTSAMRFRGERRPLREIAAELGVDYAIEGSIQKAGERVRITAQLLRATRDEHLWAESYDRDLTDIFAIQTDVAVKVATALRATLTPEELQRLDRRPTHDLHAYQLYLQGRYSLSRYTAEGIRKSIDYFEQAVELDPNFALAHVGLARAHAELANEGFLSVAPAESLERSRAAVARALEIDEELGEAHGIVGLLRFTVDFDWAGAERAFQRGLELSPGSADLHDYYGWFCQYLGRWDDAIRLLRRASELDPLSHPTDLAATYLRAGRVDEALELARQIVEFDPSLPRGHAVLGWALLLKERFREGVEELEKAVENSEGGTLFLAQLGQAYALSGRVDEAREVLARLLERGARSYVSPYHLAYVYTGLGEAEEAIDCLERACEDRSPSIAGIRSSFLFRDLRTHPRFVALLRKMKLA